MSKLVLKEWFLFNFVYFVLENVCSFAVKRSNN